MQLLCTQSFCVQLLRVFSCCVFGRMYIVASHIISNTGQGSTRTLLLHLPLLTIRMEGVSFVDISPTQPTPPPSPPHPPPHHHPLLHQLHLLREVAPASSSSSWFQSSSRGGPEYITTACRCTSVRRWGQSMYITSHFETYCYQAVQGLYGQYY